MRRRLLLGAVLALAVVAGTLVWWRQRGAELHYTGFVEGEERVLRSEVSGRVLDVAFKEGDVVPADAVIARLDDSEIAARIASKEQELAVLEAQIRRQEEQVALSESTWVHDRDARQAELRQAEIDAGLAERNFQREQGLADKGVSTVRKLDEARSRRDSARSALRRAHEVLARVEAEERNIALAKQQLEVQRRQLELGRAQLGELQVMHQRYQVRAPDTETVVQTQLLWPGELAQPGTPILAVLDPRDKYVQIYVPVADLARLRVGQRVEIELDSEPGRRVPGEVSFVADEATFTPEKIETRSDRMAQVYRAKVRILQDVERFQPGTEGNVFLVDAGAPPPSQREARSEP
jgi:multidrug resistance efflux pump